MYGAAIPEDAEAMVSKQPRNNQLRVVVALCVGVLIGALGTAMLFPQLRNEFPSPDTLEHTQPTSDFDVGMALVAGGPEAPSPSRAAMELDVVGECNKAAVKYLGGCSDSARSFLVDCQDLAKSCGSSLQEQWC